LAIPAEGEELGVGFNRVRRIDDVISRRSGNPALVLAAAVISQRARHAGWYSTLDDEAYEALFPPLISHFQDSAAALARGDVDEAAEAFRDYTTASLPLIRSSPLIERASVRPGAIERAYRIYPGIRPVKKADMVTGALRDMIFEAGWPVGLNIGTEPELMARFGVGRAVLREATRALERVGVVRTSRGAAGGLIVAEPDPAAVIDCCHRHLRREGTTPANLAEVRALVAACTGTRLKPLLLTAMDIDNS